MEKHLHNQFYGQNQPHKGKVDLEKVQLVILAANTHRSRREIRLTHDLRALSGLVRDLLLIKCHNRKKYSKTETPPNAAVLMENTKFSDRLVPYRSP